MTAWRIPGSAVLLLGVCMGMATAHAIESHAAGEALYHSGIVGSGAPLEGTRSDVGQVLQGEAAACARCHRASGLGSHEGSYSIPPISARYLYHARTLHAEQPDPPPLHGEHPDRRPYTDATLARSIREGVDPEGRVLDYLMPRFALGDADMAALIAYLKRLSPAQVRGVDPTLLQFATIITPDADPVKRQAMLDVLDRYFAEKNRAPLSGASRRQSSGTSLRPGTIDAASRHWQLHVWQLEGPPTDWTAQLERHLAQEPVMAVISGLGGKDWSPVHAFCQHARLPCLFPNLEVPVDADRDLYPVYFSRGVLLEARLIAQRLGAEAGGQSKVPVQQIFRDGDVGVAGARALASVLQASGRAVEDVVIPAGATASGVHEALDRARGHGPLVLWLRPDDLSSLGGIQPPGRPVYASGLMGGLEHTPVAADWREHFFLTYPLDLPGHRVVRVDYARGWFRLRNIPVAAEQVQVDTYVACGLLSDALKQMADNIVPEYLLELIEEAAGHRVLTGYYPRLSLGPGQRFASKGGYLVQLSGTVDGRVSALGDWVVP